jgi:hypothetical protein
MFGYSREFVLAILSPPELRGIFQICFAPALAPTVF